MVPIEFRETKTGQRLWDAAEPAADSGKVELKWQAQNAGMKQPGQSCAENQGDNRTGHPARKLPGPGNDDRNGSERQCQRRSLNAAQVRGEHLNLAQKVRR